MSTVPKVFITGVTGYIGGSVLATLHKAHPDWSYSVLLRKIPENFPKLYPTVNIIIGDFSSASILTEAAATHPIVIHAGNSDHLAAVQALLAGKPKFYIHLSGTGTISDAHNAPASSGVLAGETYSDIADLERIKTMPMERLHRAVDSVLFTVDPAITKVAIVSPPAIFGEGSGPVKTQSYMVPFFINDVLLGNVTPEKKIFTVRRGENVTTGAHIADVVAVYLKLAEAAAAGGAGADWGPDAGFYFIPQYRDYSVREVVVGIGKSMQKHGLVKNAEDVVEFEPTDPAVGHMAEGTGFALYLYGANSRSKADRVKKLWGLEAATGDLMGKTLERDVELALADKQRNVKALFQMMFEV